MAVDGYATVIFVQRAWNTSGVVQQRMRLAAAGSGFIALALLALGLAALFPDFQEGFISVILLAASASALSYTVAFATPRWLRRVWQLSELQKYLLQRSTKQAEERLNIAVSLSELCQVAHQATGGHITAIAQKDEPKQQWVWRYMTERQELVNSNLGKSLTLERVQNEGVPVFIRYSPHLGPEDRQLLNIMVADTLLLAPIAAAEHDFGLLMVFLKWSSLFVEDDLSLMALLAQQSAMFLENSALIESMRHYSESLERRVEERTEEIQKLNRQLEQRVAERTADLSRTNAELGKVVRAKDEFLANMSHELRTPLNGILILTEVLLEQIRGPLNERQTKSLETIQTSGRHLLSLINDILDLSKIEAGKLDLQIETIPVKPICETGLQFVKELAHQKRIQLSFHANNIDAQMPVDQRRLKQILINLLNNAVKFTPEGGQVSLYMNADEDQNVIRFIVEDNGIGINVADMDRLFKPFTQLDSSLTRVHEGTGLGLALVSRLVELHGGSVQVESAGIPGQGSRFTVSLPWQRLHESREEPDEASLRQTLRRLMPEEDEAVRALLIEDSPTAADQIERYLKELGIVEVIYSSGMGAQATTLATKPHLIILDILMPDQSGWDVLAQLRADSRTQAIPVIIISVVDEPARGLAAGAVQYLVKPITRQQLRAALEKVGTTLDRAEPTPEATVSHTTSQPLLQEQGSLILLAEDNEINIKAMGDYLRESGYRLSVARNGAEAFDMALELNPDLILMDVQMPVQDGLTTIKRLRALSELAQTPIIALTALAMPGDRERCLAAGANAYLSKPVSMKGLREVMNKLLTNM